MSYSNQITLKPWRFIFKEDHDGEKSETSPWSISIKPCFKAGLNFEDEIKILEINGFFLVIFIEILFGILLHII